MPASWHTLDLTWPPLRVAFPSGWSVTTFDGETFDIVIRDAAVATEQYQADIKIRRWSLTSTIKDVDAWQAEEQLAAPKHISIGGVPAIEGLGGAQRGPHNENGLPTVEEVLVIAPSGIPYIIDADCIAVYRKEDCEAIIHALHFK